MRRLRLLLTDWKEHAHVRRIHQLWLMRVSKGGIGYDVVTRMSPEEIMEWERAGDWLLRKENGK